MRQAAMCGEPTHKRCTTPRRVSRPDRRGRRRPQLHAHDHGHRVRRARHAHRLTGHPETPGHLGDRRPVQDLQHRPIPQLAHTQLPQHPGSFRHPQRSHESPALSATYRNGCRAGTEPASPTWKAGTGTQWSSMNRNCTLPSGHVAVNYCCQPAADTENRRLSNAVTCGFVGGQGRGRTADLPIFRSGPPS